MSNPENTEENREKLAQAVIEDMSIGDIMEFTFHNLVKLYSTNRCIQPRL